MFAFLVAAATLALCTGDARAALGELRADHLQQECTDIGCRMLRTVGALRAWLDGEETPPPPPQADASPERRLADAIMDKVNKKNAENIRDQCGESSDTAAMEAVRMNVGARVRECTDEARARGACDSTD